MVNAILAAAANPAPAGEPEYFHVSSGASNPLPFHLMYDYVNAYFTENPMPSGDGAIRVPIWKFPGGQKVERALKTKERQVASRERWLNRWPSTTNTRRKLTDLQAKRADLETLRTFSELYRAYVQTEIIFDDTNTRALDAALPEAVRADRGFDVTAIDWADYLQRVHFPAITTLTRAFSRRSDGPAAAPKPAALPPRTDVVAIFDLEGTVVESNLVRQYLWVRSAGFRKAAWPGEVVGLLGSVPGYLRAERRDRGEFIRVFLRRYEGMPVARLEKIVERADYRDTLLRHTSPAAVARIRAHRAAGHRTVLVTGSIGLLVSPIADLFDEVVAGEMHVKDGVLTGYLARPPLVDEARAAWLVQYAQRGGYDLSASYGYGDSHADLVWLELVGHPHAVNPDSDLAREAAKRRWRIDRWSRGATSAPRDWMNDSTAQSRAQSVEGAGG